MKKYETVKLEKDFNNIIKKGHFIKNNYFVIYNLPNDLTFPRFGLAVGKKLGNAVERNKFKRQLRSIIDENKKYFNKGQDYIIMIKGTCKSIKFSEMKESFASLIKEKKWKSISKY